MTPLGIYITVGWTLLCTCAAIPDVHLKMSPSQLHEVFHVNELDLVPHYELVKLSHLTAQHVRKKRSIASTSSSSKLGSSASGSSNSNNLVNNNNHHVKKDLSKSAPYSEKTTTTTTTSTITTTTTTTERSSIFANNRNQNQNQFQNETSIKVSDQSDTSDLRVSEIKEHKVTFDAFGEKLNLTLRPTEGLFRNGPQSLKMWHAHPDPSATDGINYEEIKPVDDSLHDEQIGQIFQDEANMAAILLRKHKETGDFLMEGSIGHQLVIKPLPKALNPENDDGISHVVYKRESNIDYDKFSDFAFMEPDHIGKRFRRKRFASNLTMNSAGSHSRSKRGVPHIIYPEILVIVDYDGYRLHGGDNVQVKRYFVAFWNGVDLRYRLLKGPKIRISIAGIIISRGRDATPYLERNRVGRDAIDSAAALTDMGKYLFRERRLPVYDIAVAITKIQLMDMYDMCRRRKGGRCTKGTAGFAYVGGACVVNKRLEKVNSVAIIEDTGGFSGIIVAAHEVGHLLGAVHDGSPPPSYLGGPGAEKCRWEDGYIMSDLRHTERGFRWSPCSVQSFHHFLNGDTASCLHNAPHEDEALGRALPGTLLSLDAQCRRDRGTSACFKDERVCAQLFCFDAASGYCVAYRPAAEGSSCGDGQHCMDGRCVAEHENIIPDYSQHTPSYASPNAYNNQPINDGYSYNSKDVDAYGYTTPSTSTTTPSTTTPSTTTSTWAPPPSTTSYFNNPFHNRFQKYNYNQNNNNNYYSSSTTTTTPAPATTRSPFQWNYYKAKTIDTANVASNPPKEATTRVPYANIRPSTYKSVFDVYFNQIAAYQKSKKV